MSERVTGDRSRLEYTVIGYPVNRVAKLEKHTKAEGVAALCTAESYRLALQQGYVAAARLEQRHPMLLAPIRPGSDHDEHFRATFRRRAKHLRKAEVVTDERRHPDARPFIMFDLGATRVVRQFAA